MFLYHAVRQLVDPSPVGINGALEEWAMALRCGLSTGVSARWMEQSLMF